MCMQNTYNNMNLQNAANLMLPNFKSKLKQNIWIFIPAVLKCTNDSYYYMLSNHIISSSLDDDFSNYYSFCQQHISQMHAIGCMCTTRTIGTSLDAQCNYITDLKHGCLYQCSGNVVHCVISVVCDETNIFCQFTGFQIKHDLFRHQMMLFESKL